MSQRTPLFDAHLAANGKIVDFAGWEMPINYGSQIKEHEAVRTDAGMFDVSHMTAVDVRGERATEFFQKLIGNDVAKLGFEGKALYSGMYNEAGGVIDDLIVYRTHKGYRVVVNAGTTDKDLAWMQPIAAQFHVELMPRRDLAMIAVQGPNAIAKTKAAKPEVAALIDSLQVFQGLPHGEWFFARTGYTGEDGLEISMPAAEAIPFWNKLLEAGVAPAGLGARDTLRLEAGMNLYGNEMDDAVSPLAAGMGWTIVWEPASRDFVGRKVLEKEKAERAGSASVLKQVGLVYEGKGVLRGHMKVVTTVGDGEITSGTFSPTLQISIAMARVPLAVKVGDAVQVDIRGTLQPARVVKIPFVRNGKKVFE
ncbi:glycine cleavage system aminomethyltransferase GcvT [Chitinimonas sp. BJB300]|uniref:glycine cleavage system aminomethyltransferase GcvT n=1 Tax=Chitinimonas sp. BJB300 TaxID=1559339 RepID=UPI000C0FC5EA|nr:glycine cleavage system aminomethyltransferase GcvT [Chitinimonas sp. BJB300]PHV10142.1 glycine cleavage system protein T [Chitinimonas sp. BJB300]TSJ91156.1 glycine cleavage system aminomethyltransferase GcvT [Chitinimonas sp. BJB300]